MWKPKVPSPSMAITGAALSAARAAMANGIDAPIEPAGPLMMRRAGVSMACGHCANSPPSHTRTACRSRCEYRLPARGTPRPDAACPARCDARCRPMPAADTRAPRATSLSHRRLRIALARPARAVRRPQRWLGIGAAAENEPRAFLAPHALDHRRLRIDRDEPAAGIDERRIPETQGEIVRLAQQHDQVRLPQYLREGAEPRVVDAARALHRHDRNAGRSSSCRNVARSPEWQSCGPASTSGRLRARRARRELHRRRHRRGAAAAKRRPKPPATAWAHPPPSPRADRTAGSGAPAPAGPTARSGRPRPAPRPASPRSAPSARPWSTGAAMSAWRSSWNAPRPISPRPA